MTLTTAFALGIGAGLLISFFRELYIKHRTVKREMHFYFAGYQEAANHAIKLTTEKKQLRMKKDLESHLNTIIEVLSERKDK